MSVAITKSEHTRRSLDNVFGSNENYLTYPVSVYGTKKSKDDKSKLETTIKLKTLLVTTSTVIGDYDNDKMYEFNVLLKFGKNSVTALSLSLSYEGKITTKIDDSLLIEGKYIVDCDGLGLGSPCHKIAKESLAKLSLTHDPAIHIFLDIIDAIKGLDTVTIDPVSSLPIVTRLDLDPLVSLSAIAKHGINADQNSILYLVAEQAQNILPETLDASVFDDETLDAESSESETSEETVTEDLNLMTKKQLLSKCLQLGLDANRSMSNDALRELLTVNV